MTRVAPHLLSLACGLVMVTAVGADSSGPARTVALSGLIAVASGAVFRPLATLAVVLTAAVIAMTGPAAVEAAVAGLAAVLYLTLRHGAANGAGLDSVGTATMVAALGFTLAGLVATAFPLRVAWLPLTAPLAVFAVYLMATRPFLHDEDD